MTCSMIGDGAGAGTTSGVENWVAIFSCVTCSVNTIGVPGLINGAWFIECAGDIGCTPCIGDGGVTTANCSKFYKNFIKIK